MYKMTFVNKLGIYFVNNNTHDTKVYDLNGIYAYHVRVMKSIIISSTKTVVIIDSRALRNEE